MGDNLSVSECVTLVYQAARDGSSNLTDLLKRLKNEQRKTALETKTKDGSHFVTPLIIAAHNGHLNSVKILLGYGADIEARGTLKIGNEVAEGCTPLWGAAAADHLAVVKLLLEQNADVDSKTSTGSTPLRVAAHEGHLDIVRCLVHRGADVNARNDCNEESTALVVACSRSLFSEISVVDTFLIQQCKVGRTALHDAVERGHLKIVSELLALGASQLPNGLGLTPLLYACDECFIEMVEHIINRPECTKEQRIDALELLGATIANDMFGDSEKAFSYMKRGMEMRYEDPAHPLLKNKTEPVEAYQNRKESQTLEELALLEGDDDHAIGMEGLIISERILGPDNPATLPRIANRAGAGLFVQPEKYDLCIGLFLRGLEKTMNINVVKITTEFLAFLTGIFEWIVQEGILLRPNYIEDAFEKLVAASEKRTEKLKSKNSQEEQTLYCALCLLMIHTKVKGQNANMTDFLQRFLSLNPRTNDGNTLLHLAAWHETPVFSNADDEAEDMLKSVCKLPCVETMKLILHAGCDVNAVNTGGNTPLHLAVTFKPADPKEVVILSEMLLSLLEIGADPKLPNKNGKTPLHSCETDEARRILSEKRGLSAMNVDVGDVSNINIL